MQPGPASAPGSRTSSPVEKTAARSRARTASSATPTEAARPTSWARSRVPAEILAKPGRLSEIEYALIKQHPQEGYEILKDVKFPWPIADIVWQHHERLDGSGYPQGLKGDAILLESRVMAVADVMEAMSSHRPYRAGLGVDAALKEIERGRDSIYDPVVVDACLKLFAENRFTVGSTSS